MKRIIVFIVISILYGSNILAQQRIISLGVIKGNVSDSSSGKPIEYANVAIYSAKTDSLKYGTVTDDKGNFISEGIKPGNYILKVSFIGFKTFKSSILKINQKQSKVVLGNIRLKPESKELNTVVIEGVSKPFEQTFDKKIFQMDDQRAAGAQTVLDLLKTLPSVTVDPDGNVKFRGQTPNILVDNQPYNLLYPKLEMIPAVNVEKIEFIDPSARFQSSAGTINIKLKRPKENGLSGAIYSNLSTQDFKSLSQNYYGLNFNYLYKKVIVFVNGYYGQSNNNYIEKENMTLNYHDTLYESTSNSSSSGSNSWGSANAGLIYNFSKSSKLTVTWTPSVWEYNTSSMSDYNEISEDIEREQFNGQSNSNSHNFSNSFLLNYRKAPEDDSKEFTIKLSYSNQPTTSNSQGLNYFSYYNYHFFPIDSLANIKNNTTSRNDVFSLEIQRRKNIDSTGRWETGLQGEYYHNTTQNDYYFDSVHIPDYSNYMKFYYYKATWYGNFGKKIKKFKLDAGLRLSLIGGGINNLVYPGGKDSLITINKFYFLPLPNITIGYEIKPLHELKITYSFDLQPPDKDQLNPYVNRSDPRNWHSGNSNLLPYQFHRFTFGYMYAPGFYSISVDAFTNLSDNYVESVSEPLNNYTTLTKPYNIGKTTESGLSLSAIGMFAKWFNANLSMSVFYSTVNASALPSELTATPISTDGLKSNTWSANGSFFMNITILKKYTVATYLYYGGRDVSLGGYSQYGLFDGLYLSRKFFKNKFNVTLGITNLVQTNSAYKSSQEYLGKSYYTEYNGSWNKRTYNIGIRYYFNKGDRGLMNNQQNGGGNQMPGKK